MSVSEHKATAAAPSAVRVAVITVSDTRTTVTDQGGDLVKTLATAAGFAVVGHDLVPDEPEVIRARVRALVSGPPADASAPAAGADGFDGTHSPGVDVILLTGGTGVAPRDGTVEALAPLFERRLDGFGELFRMLSFAEIGAAAMLSRACAGIATGGVAVFLMPGSPAAIRLAMQRLILPELGHLVSELHRELHRSHATSTSTCTSTSASTPDEAPRREHHPRHGQHDHHGR